MRYNKGHTTTITSEVCPVSNTLVGGGVDEIDLICMNSTKETPPHMVAYILNYGFRSVKEELYGTCM